MATKTRRAMVWRAALRRAGSPARSPRCRPRCWRRCASELARGRRRTVRRRGAAAGRGVRLGDGDRGRPRSARRPPQRRRSRRAPELAASLYQPGQMRRRLDQLIETNSRYGHPFGLVVFDVDGPGTRDGEGGGGQETVLAVVGAALRESIRIVDEAFRLEEDALCVLAPNLTTVEGGADGRAAAAAAGRAGGRRGAADRDLGRRRRLSRARRRRRAACCRRPTRRCGGPVRWASRWASALCKIADRFRKSVHNWRKPGFPWEMPMSSE